MVKVIIGRKGSGKTKKLVDLVNTAANTSEGNIVCIEKGSVLTYDVVPQVRLIDADDYQISGYEELYGFIAGIMARDYDLTQIYLDGIKKIGGLDMDELSQFINKMNDLTTKNTVDLIVTVSYDVEEIPETIKSLVINA